MVFALLISVFLIATCGLIYQLIAGTVASYVIGDSVTQFSTIIGTYLFSMGIGSFLSRYVGRDLIFRFVQTELIVGLVGGMSATLMFIGFSHTSQFRLILYLTVVLIGTGVGLEIPLLLRILKDHLDFRDLVAQVLTLDYVGALVASLLFPLVLVPNVGLVRSAFLFGLLNALVALVSTWIFREHLGRPSFLRFQCVAVCVLLLAGLIGAERITSFSEESLYADEIILRKRSPYQNIVLTRWRDDLRLFLNGHLQFSTADEYRYHEVLVHPGLGSVPVPRTALILGGGDGMAAREILKHPSVTSIQLVDLDPDVTGLFSTHPVLTGINEGALTDPKVTVVNADGFRWLDENDRIFDFIVVDLPDPGNYSVGKLYTNTFYRLLKKRLSFQGVAVVQATSPLFARRSFWCIANTMKSEGFALTPIHAYVPSFGEWGFVVAGHRPISLPGSFPPGLKFVGPGTVPSLTAFPPDMAWVETEINRLNNQILVRYYEDEWKKITP